MPPCNRRTRREFLKTGLAAGTLAISGGLPLAAQRGKATDLVTLGRSGVKVTRLAFGTGTISGKVQRELGQEGFTRLVRHAYDSGIRFFETAESYGEMHKMLGIALKGIPRDSYRIMSKVTTKDGVDPLKKFDELRTLANTEYFDIMLLHWQHTATWPADTARWQDAIREVAGTQGRARARRLGSRSAGPAPGSRQRLPPGRDDSREPHRQGHGRRGLQHAGPRQRAGSRLTRPGGPQAGHGRDLDEAGGEGHVRSRGPAEGDAVRVPATPASTASPSATRRLPRSTKRSRT